MYAKIATRTIVAIAPIARRTVVESLGTVGPLGAGAGGCSMGSALDNRLAALRAELHAAGDVVAVRAFEGLGRAALRTEFLSRPDHLAALDARLAARGDRAEGLFDRGRQREVQSADLEDLHAEGRKVRLRIRERALFDVVEAHSEIDDLEAVRLHLAERDVELLHELVLDPVLDFRRCRGTERSDELVDERLRVLDPVPEVPERAELHHVEVRVLEQERVLRAELPVEDALLEVVHLGLLDDAGQGLDEFAQDGDVLGREGVPVRAVQVCEDLPIPVEDRDLVLPDDDVVVHPDVPGDLPHDVLSLELVVPRHRHGADEAFLPACCLVRPPRAAEEERNRDHRRHLTWMPVTAIVRFFHAVSNAAIASRHAFSEASKLFGSAASWIIGTTAAALSSESSIA